MDSEYENEMDALDRVAERAGGYVALPSTMTKAERAKRDGEFSMYRQYCIEMGLPHLWRPAEELVR